MTGELRFDQPCRSVWLTPRGRCGRGFCPPGREVVAIASGVEGEEELYTAAIADLRAAAAAQGRPAPVFVYVPARRNALPPWRTGWARPGWPSCAGPRP